MLTNYNMTNLVIYKMASKPHFELAWFSRHFGNQFFLWGFLLDSTKAKNPEAFGWEKKDKEYCSKKLPGT
jgi:hypothetical protein